MTEWNHNAIALRMEVPRIPSPEEWEAGVRDRRERAHRAVEAAEALVVALGALDGPLGAVGRLHLPNKVDVSDSYAPWGCSGCCDAVDWPCETVAVLANELDLELPKHYDLPYRGDLEPLDAPIPPLPTHALQDTGFGYFLRVPRPESFVKGTFIETLSTILDPD